MTEVAIHESGHAMMFDALGAPIEFVTIIEGCCGERPSFEGCVKLQRECNPAYVVLAGTLAGPGASFFIAGVVPNEGAIEKYQSDQKVLQQIHRDQKDAGTYEEFWLLLNQFLAVWMRSWLVNRKHVILRFANLLQAADTLHGDELRRALESAWASSKPDVQDFQKEVQDALRQSLE